MVEEGSHDYSEGWKWESECVTRVQRGPVLFSVIQVKVDMILGGRSSVEVEEKEG